MKKIIYRILFLLITSYIPIHSYADNANECIIEYTSTDGNIVIPNSKNAFLDSEGNPIEIISNLYENGKGTISFNGIVTSLNQWVFLNCTTLKTIKLPTSIVSITWAFQGCSSLEEIKLSDKLKSIDTASFSGCSSLTEIRLPATLQFLGPKVFDGCSSLSTIICKSESAPNISKISFWGINRNGVLKYPHGSDYSKWLSDELGYLGYFGWTGEYISNEDRGTSTITYTTSNNDIVTYGASMWTSNGIGSFADIDGNELHVISNTYENGVGTLTFDGVISIIGSRMFNFRDNLTSIVLPNTITEIGEQAFWQCNNLKRITCLSKQAPTIFDGTFSYIGYGGILIYPEESDYTDWLVTKEHYLGYQDWQGVRYNTEKGEYVGCSIIDYTTTDGQLYYPNYYELRDTNGKILREVENTYEKQGKIVLSGELETAGVCSFGKDSRLTSISLPASLKSLDTGALGSGFIGGGVSMNLQSIVTYATIAPSIDKHTFYGISRNGVLYCPEESDYSSWFSGEYGLGNYGWTIKTLEEYEASPIKEVSKDEIKTKKIYYAINGERHPILYKGINIIKYSDGLTRKVLIK